MSVLTFPLHGLCTSWSKNLTSPEHAFDVTGTSFSNLLVLLLMGGVSTGVDLQESNVYWLSFLVAVLICGCLWNGA